VARGTIKRRIESCGEQRLVARRPRMPSGRVSAWQAQIMDYVGRTWVMAIKPGCNRRGYVAMACLCE
jgi:hypothetical protein